MLDGLIVIGALASYFAGFPEVTFWILVLAVANGALAVLMAIVNPEWYSQKRAEHMAQRGKIEFNLERKVPISFFITKLVIIAVIGYFAWRLGASLDYI